MPMATVQPPVPAYNIIVCHLHLSLRSDLGAVCGLALSEVPQKGRPYLVSCLSLHGSVSLNPHIARPSCPDSPGLSLV